MPKQKIIFYASTSLTSSCPPGSREPVRRVERLGQAYSLLSMYNGHPVISHPLFWYIYTTISKEPEFLYVFWRTDCPFEMGFFLSDISIYTFILLLFFCIADMLILPIFRIVFHYYREVCHMIVPLSWLLDLNYLKAQHHNRDLWFSLAHATQC